MKKSITYLFIIALILPGCSALKQLGIEPTALETLTALRNVLDSSAFKAVKTLGKMKTGGVESVVPKEVAAVLGQLSKLGLGDDIDKVAKKVGEASALVAEEGGIIMKDAIKEVKFDDAVAIVVHGEDAATQALRHAMYGSVKKRYTERLDAEFEKIPETQYWDAAKGAYNLFSKDKVEGGLSDFVAERAVDAMFIAMGKEERKIRKDPASLGKAVVTKVFDYYQKKQNKRS